MNIRTNLRTSRKDTIYIVAVATVGQGRPYLQAQFLGTTTLRWLGDAMVARYTALKDINDTLEVYQIAYDSEDGIKSPAAAVQQAVYVYAKAHGIDLDA